MPAERKGRKEREEKKGKKRKGRKEREEKKGKKRKRRTGE